MDPKTGRPAVPGYYWVRHPEAPHPDAYLLFITKRDINSDEFYELAEYNGPHPIEDTKPKGWK